MKQAKKKKKHYPSIITSANAVFLSVWFSPVSSRYHRRPTGIKTESGQRDTFCIYQIVKPTIIMTIKKYIDLNAYCRERDVPKVNESVFILPIKTNKLTPRNRFETVVCDLFRLKLKSTDLSVRTDVLNFLSKCSHEFTRHRLSR